MLVDQLHQCNCYAFQNRVSRLPIALSDDVVLWTFLHIFSFFLLVEYGSSCYLPVPSYWDGGPGRPVLINVNNATQFRVGWWHGAGVDNMIPFLSFTWCIIPDAAKCCIYHSICCLLIWLKHHSFMLSTKCWFPGIVCWVEPCHPHKSSHVWMIPPFYHRLDEIFPILLPGFGLEMQPFLFILCLYKWGVTSLRLSEYLHW